MIVVEGLFLLCIVLLSIYGLNSLILVVLYLRHHGDPTPWPPSPASPAEWPCVTVQLPLYNELYTVRRLLNGAAALDYPHGRLEVQLLDDSTGRPSLPFLSPESSGQPALRPERRSVRPG